MVEAPPPPPQLQVAPYVAPQQQPPAPAVELLQLWQALEGGVAPVFGLEPKPEPRAVDVPNLDAYWKGHERDLAWCLDTQATWIARNRKYVAGLSRPGDTSVLLRPQHWQDARRARPRPPAPVSPVANQNPEAAGPWMRALEVLREDGKHYALSWLERIAPLELRDGVLILGVPDSYFQAWVDDHYRELLADALGLVEQGLRFEFEVVQEEPPSASFPKAHRFTQPRAAA